MKKENLKNLLLENEKEREKIQKIIDEYQELLYQKNKEYYDILNEIEKIKF